MMFEINLSDIIEMQSDVYWFLLKIA